MELPGGAVTFLEISTGGGSSSSGAAGGSNLPGGTINYGITGGNPTVVKAVPPSNIGG